MRRFPVLFYFLPLNLIQVQRFSPTAAGAALLPVILIVFILSRWAGGLVARYGSRVPLVAGPMIVAAGFVLFLRPDASANYWTMFFPAIVVLGVGMAISVAPLTTTVMNAVDARWAGIASGVNNAVSRTGGLLSVAVFGIVMLQIFAHRFAESIQKIPLPTTASDSLYAQRFDLAGVNIPAGLDPALREAVRQAIDTSFVSGFRELMMFSAGLAILSAFAAGLMIHGARTSSTPSKSN